MKCVIFVLVLAKPGLAQNTELQASLDALLEQEADSSSEQRAQALATWMDSHEWKKLYFAKGVNLLMGLSQRGEWDRELSVRWSGFLTAPSTGAYHLEQLHNPYAVGDFRVWVAGQLVLDSRPEAAQQLGTESRFRSLPVSLTADQPVTLKVEFVRTPRALQLQVVGYPKIAQPVAALMWESANVTKQLIPPTAYTPPADFQPDSNATQGLKAEYFSDQQFQQPLFTLRDQGVDLLTRVAATGVRAAKVNSVRNHFFKKLRSPGFSAKISGDKAAAFWNKKSIRDFTEHASIWQRAQLVDWLLEHPEVLAADNKLLFGGFFPRVVMLPGQRRLQLLRGWSKDRVLQPSKISFYPDNYHRVNVPKHRRIGAWLQGPHAADVETLVANDLADSDGHCRIDLVVAIAHGIAQSGQAGPLREKINEHVNDSGLPGDAKASWLIGQGLAEEALSGVPVRPHLTFPYLTEAMLRATSDTMRFQILGQHVPRLFSLGRFAEGRAKLDEWAGRLTDPEHQELIGQWRSEADELEAGMDTFKADREQKIAEERRVNRVAMLQQRLERARKRGDSAMVSRYQEMIQSATPQP